MCVCGLRDFEISFNAISGEIGHISTSGRRGVWYTLSMSKHHKKKKQVTLQKESIFIVDLRENFSNRTYVYDFDESDVHLLVWTALMALKADGKFYFPNVDDVGYHQLVPDAANRRPFDYDFKDFFDDAMDEQHRFPQAGDTASTPQKCSWMVYLVEELRMPNF